MKAIAIPCAVVVRGGTVLVCFKTQLVTNIIAVFPLLDSIRGPRMLLLTYVNDSVGGNGFKFIAYFQILCRSLTQKVHFLNTLWASTVIDVQLKCWWRYWNFSFVLPDVQRFGCGATCEQKIVVRTSG